MALTPIQWFEANLQTNWKSWIFAWPRESGPQSPISDGYQEYSHGLETDGV